MDSRALRRFATAALLALFVAITHPAHAQAGPPYQVDDPDYCDLGCSGTFLVNETHGTWQQATVNPGLTYILWLTCPAAGDCVAAGANDNSFDVWTGRLVPASS